MLTVSSASTCPSSDQHPSTSFRKRQHTRFRFRPHVSGGQRHDSVARRNLYDYANTKLMSLAAGGVWATSQVPVRDVPRLSNFEPIEATWKFWNEDKSYSKTELTHHRVTLLPVACSGVWSLDSKGVPHWSEHSSRKHSVVKWICRILEVIEQIRECMTENA